MKIEYVGPLEKEQTVDVEYLGPIESEREAKTALLTPISALPIPKGNPDLKVAEKLGDAGLWMGNQLLAGIEATLGLASGALLWPFSKAYGLMALPWGREASEMAEEEIGKLGYQPRTDLGKQALETAVKPIEWFLTPSKIAGKAAGEGRLGYAVETLGEFGQFALLGPAKGGIKRGIKKVKEARKPKVEFIEDLKPEEIIPKEKVVEEVVKEEPKVEFLSELEPEKPHIEIQKTVEKMIEKEHEPIIKEVLAEYPELAKEKLPEARGEEGAPKEFSWDQTADISKPLNEQPTNVRDIFIEKAKKYNISPHESLKDLFRQMRTEISQFELRDWLAESGINFVASSAKLDSRTSGALVDLGFGEDLAKAHINKTMAVDLRTGKEFNPYTKEFALEPRKKLIAPRGEEIEGKGVGEVEEPGKVITKTVPLRKAPSPEGAKTFRGYVKAMGGINPKDPNYKGEIKRSVPLYAKSSKTGLMMDELLAQIKERGDWKGVIETEQDILDALTYNAQKPKIAESNILTKELESELKNYYDQKDSFLEQFSEREIEENIRLADKDFRNRLEAEEGISKEELNQFFSEVEKESFKIEKQRLFEKPEDKFELKPTEPVSKEEQIAWERMQGKIGKGEKTKIRPVIPTEAIRAPTTGKQEGLFPKELQKGETVDMFEKKDTTLETGGLQTAFEQATKLNVPKSLKSAWVHFKEFWSPFSSVPQGKKALTARYKSMGDLARSERFIDNIHERLDKYPDDVKKDIFRYLDGQITVDTLPIEARNTAQSLQGATKRIGQMLVNRGLIKEEQFNKYKGKYIHYMYAKHILGDETSVPIQPTGKLNLSYAKSRKDLTSQQRKTLGLIEDASIAVPVGMGKALTDIAKYDYLDTLARNPDWVWEPSIVEVPLGKKGGLIKMGIGKLVDEVAVFERMAREMPSPEIQARYDILKTALDKAMADTANVPSDFTQLPNIRTYGPLAGAYLRKPIADDLRPIMGSIGERGKLFETLVNIEQQGMVLLKIGKVPFNLPTGIRNVVSNLLQNNMRGRALAYIPGDIVDAMGSMLEKDRYYGEAFRNGLFKHSWAATEITEILNTFSKAKTGNYADFLKAVRHVAKYYGKIDDVAKHAIYVQMRKAGNPVDVSVLEAAKWGMDYSLASRSVKHLRQHIVPFLSYQYKIAPLIAESLAKRPWVIGKFLAVGSLAVAATMALNDLTDKDWDKLKRQLPSYIKRSGSYIIMPMKSPQGQWQWVNLEYYFPWGNMFNLFRDIEQKDMGEIYRDLGISNPYMDIARMMASAKEDKPPQHPFYGTDIYNRLDPSATKAAKVMEAIMFTWLPSMLSRKGALGYSLQAAKGEKDKWGRDVTPAQAIGRWFGLNIISVSSKQTQIIKKAKIRDLRRDLFKVTLDPTISKEEKKATKERYKKELTKLRDGE